MLSVRIQNLREQVLHAGVNMNVDIGGGGTGRSYKARGVPLAPFSGVVDLHPTVRFARDVEKVMDSLPVGIKLHERIVGDCTMIFIESHMETRPHLTYFIDPNRVRQSGIDGFKDPAADKVFRELSGLREAIDAGFARGVFVWANIGHAIPDTSFVLANGMDAVVKKCRRRIDELERAAGSDSQPKLGFYEGTITICEAFTRWVRRHADEARRCVDVEEDPLRRSELQTIAEVCEHVSGGGARNFQEALQLSWFLDIFLEMFSPGHGGERFDQLLYPFFKKDTDSGELTREEALELLEERFLKFMKHTIGGSTPDGRDATNELSWLCLEALDELNIAGNLYVRHHENIDREFFLYACRLMKRMGTPQFSNERAVIAGKMRAGISREDAWNYAGPVCAFFSVPGKEFSHFDISDVNLLKSLELALQNGIDPLSGRLVGLKTGDPLEFTSFDELLGAYKKQAADAVRLFVQLNDKVDMLLPLYSPESVLSIFYPECLERGVDFHGGGAKYNSLYVHAGGAPNTADSLAAIKKLVFEEKRVRMDELLKALQANFKGFEALRQLLVNHAPKWGNDDDYVDGIMVEITEHFFTEVGKYSCHWGGPCVPVLYTWLRGTFQGKFIGATPDGRMSGVPVALGLMPSPGRNREGITAAINSLSKIDYSRTAAAPGQFILPPRAFDGAGGVERLASLVEVYFKKGGLQFQGTLVDRTTLEEARRSPEKYRDLQVRVTGFSAYFTALEDEVQEMIIGRAQNA